MERELAEFEYLLLERGAKLSGLILEKEVFQDEILKQEVKIKEIGSLIPGVLYKAETDINGNSRFTYFSERFKDFFGVEPIIFFEDYSNIWKFVHPNDVEAVSKSITNSNSSGLDWYNEFRFFNSKNQEYFWVRASSTSVVDVEGKINTYGSFTNITDLKQKESQLNAIISSVDDVVFLFSNEGVCRNIWTRDPNKLGKDFDSFTNKKYIEIFGHENNLLFFEAIENLKNQADTFEYNFSFEINSKLLYFKARVGKLKSSLEEDQFYYTIKDISDIRESQLESARLNDILQVASVLGKVGAFEYNIQNKEVIWSDELYSMFNGDRALKGTELYKHYMSMLHPEDRAEQPLRLEEAINSEQPYENEHRIIMKDGSIKWIVSISKVIFDDLGKPFLLRGVKQDITERKLDFFQREKDRNLLHQASELGKLGGWSLDFKTNLVNWTDQIYEIFEIDLSIDKKDIYNIYVNSLHPEDKDELFRLISDLRTNKLSFVYTHRIVLPNDRIKYLFCKGEPVIVGNVVVGIKSIVQDITERKIIEIELEKNRKLFDLIALSSVNLQSELHQDKAVLNLLEKIGLAVDASRVYIIKNHFEKDIDSPELKVVYEWTGDNSSIAVNEFDLESLSFELFRNLEWKEQFQKGFPVSGNLSEFNENIQKILNSKNIKSILILPVVVDGLLWGYFGFDECRKERVWTESELSLLTSASGLIGNAIKSFRIQSELDQSELKYTSVLNAMNEGVVIYDANYSILAANKSACSILGFQSKDEICEAIKTKSLNIFNEDLTVLKFEEFPSYKVFKESKPVENVIIGFSQINVPIKWIKVTASPIISEDSNNELGVVVIFADVTEKITTEKELIKVSLVAQKTSCAVLILGANRLIEWINDGFVSIFGYSIDEVVNKPINGVLIREYDNSEISDYIINKVDSNQAFDVETKVKKKDGREFWTKMEFQPAFDSNNLLMNYVVFLFDIDESKRTEQIINESLREKEVLLNQIHHRVKINYAIVSSLLQLQLLYSNEESCIRLIKESQSRLKSMALVHEKLYESGNLSSINFSTYINEIRSHIDQSYSNQNAKIEFSSSNKNIKLDVSVAVPCGLILNELLTNSFMHAFVGKDEGVVFVSLEENGEYFTLEVNDNGIGIPNAIDFDKLKTLGLTLVKTLVHQLNGTLNYRSNNGSKFIITFPRNSSNYVSE